MEFNQFKEKFINEALGLTNSLEESLLDNEENLNNSDNIQQIFRVMHTLKGVSSMYGFDYIGEIAHHLESIFDLIRDNKKIFTEPIFDITLKTVDHFRKLLADEKLEDENNKMVHNQLLDAIHKHILSGNDLIESDDTENADVKDTQKETFYIIFYPNESLLFRGVNILRLFEDLADLGEYKIINHAFKEHESKYNEHNAWGVYLVTDQGIAGIEEVFMFVLDDCKILKISNENLFNHKEFVKDIDAVKKNTNTQLEQAKLKVSKTIEKINANAQIPAVENELKAIDDEEAVDEIVENIILESETIIESENQIDKPALPDSNLKNLGKDLTSRISIEASKLDQLMYLVSELVITKSQLSLSVKNSDYSRLITISEKIDDLSRKFRDNALSIRLVSVAEMIMPFKRLVRDLSKGLGKDIKFITQGIDTELDKNVIDRLAEPVMHILRNCIDHGIETPEIREANGKTPFGSIKFSSYYSGANVYIQIQDDGAGIDPERIKRKAIEKGLIHENDTLTEKDIYNLIFQAGFSTAEQVSEISGRGVGMDIVRKKIQEVRGEVEINSVLGKGTEITIKLHQTLSIMDTLLLQVDDVHYLVPISDIEFCEQKSHDQLYQNKNRQVEIENNLIPFVSIRDVFNHKTAYPAKEKLVIINKNEHRIAIVADKIIGEHQAVLKPLGEVFQSQKYLSGASILGDGKLALMLDVSKLTDKSLLVQQSQN